MAVRYVSSVTGNDANGGTSWVDAKATGVGVAVIDTAGDDLFFDSAHLENYIAATTFTFAGTAANPVKLVSVSSAAIPPTTVTDGATLRTTGNFAITMSGSAYVDGMIFDCGGAVNLCTNGGNQYFKNCKFRLTNTGSAGVVSMPQGNTPIKAVLSDCSIKFNATSQRIIAGHRLEIKGGSLESGSLTPTSFMQHGSDGRGGVTMVSGFDFTNATAGMHLVASNSVASGLVTFRDCKLPPSWSGSLLSGSFSGNGLRVEMFNCDGGDTNYRLWVEEYGGSIKSEPTLVKTGGSSDGVVPFSMKMATNANANPYNSYLTSPDIFYLNDVVGSPITIELDILHDSLTALTDLDVWIDVQYLGTSGYPLASFLSDRKADFLVAPAAQTTSSATWTTTGMTNPNKQKLAVTITPQELGYLSARVVLAKASTTIYADVELQVS